MKNFLLSILAVANFLMVLSSCKKDDAGRTKETVVYETDFSEDDGKWYVGNTAAGVRISIEDGYYRFKAGAGGGWMVWTGNVFTDAGKGGYVEASVKLSPNGNNDYGFGGLIWGMVPSDADANEFRFDISYNGYYRILGFPDGEQMEYKPWTTLNTIRNNQFNTLKIQLKNQQIYFYINDREVHSMPAGRWNTLDRLGCVVARNSNMEVDGFRAVETQ